MQPPQETGIHESALLPNHVFQTILEAPHGNALQACAASILGLPLGDMPNFVDASDYWAAMLAHARLLNLGLIKVPLTENGQLPYPSAPGTLCLARGNSPRGPQGHVVVAAVAADGTSLKLVHDPWPNGLGLDGPASWAAFYTALSPATVAKASLACEDASESSASTKSVFQTNTVDPALPALPSSALSSATSHPPPMASPVPRSSRVAFIGNSYVYYNDLPRLLETLAGPTVLARTGVCLRGGASLPGLMGPRGGSANVLPGSDVAGLGVGSTPVGTVRDLLVGGEGAAHVPPAPPADPGTKDSKAAASFAPASAIDKEGTAHPESGLWDTVVLNDYSQAAALPTDRAQTEKCLREQYAPLFVAAKSVRMVVFYVPPAYRAHTKGSEQIGSWEDFTRLQSEGHEAYRRALEDGLSDAAAHATSTTSSNAHREETRGSVHVRMADVNAAYALVRAARPDLWHNLFASDNFHPSPTGSFLAAAVILRALVGVQPLPAVAQAPPPTAATGNEPAEILFARARRPLADKGPLPSADDMAFLWDIAMRP